jgi:hypothetical protein
MRLLPDDEIGQESALEGLSDECARTGKPARYVNTNVRPAQETSLYALDGKLNVCDGQRTVLQGFCLLGLLLVRDVSGFGQRRDRVQCIFGSSITTY